MEFRLLGPLEIIDGGRAVPLGGPRQRALLGLLLIRRNEPVTSERIVDALWEHEPPRTAAQIVRVYVSQLRKLVGADVLASYGGGYVLRVDEEQVDAARFERLVGEAGALSAEGDPDAAVAAYDQALALWRGDPLPELAYERFAQPEIARLEELRLTACESRFDAALRAGRDAELVPPLERLIAAHPLRERLRAQLMLALYRTGRQADALAVYQDGRRLLVEELGLEPSEELRRLEARILQHDPALEANTAAHTPPMSGVGRRRRDVVPLVALAALVLAAATGTYVFVHSHRGSHAAAAPDVAQRRVLRIAVVNPIPRPATAAENPVAEQPIAGMQSAAARLGLQTRAYWNGAFRPALNWANLIVVGAAPGLGGTANMARDYPHTRFLLSDTVARRGSPFRGLRNVTGLDFDNRELGYLAGALAALMAKPRSAVSAVGGVPVPAVRDLIAGYIAGARSIRPQIRVLAAYSQTFVAQGPCESVANSQINRGATVVFDVAGACGYGAMQAAGIRGVWGIGVDSDLSYLGPQILASAVKRFDRATEVAVALFARGELPPGDIHLNLANDSIGLVGISDRVPAPVRTRLETIASRLRAHDKNEHG
jgi:DNA-binding SARP family transcriptional activator